VTKPKAVHFSTQTTEKYHKEKNIFKIHQIRHVAQFPHVSFDKAAVF
jgi:hypothetical protein